MTTRYHSLCEACDQRRPLVYDGFFCAALCVACKASPPAQWAERRLHAIQLAKPLTMPMPGERRYMLC